MKAACAKSITKLEPWSRKTNELLGAIPIAEPGVNTIRLWRSENPEGPESNGNVIPYNNHYRTRPQISRYF